MLPPRNVRKTNEEFIRDARLIHGERYLYPKVNYVRTSDNVIITCRIHGDFEQTPNSHLRGKGCRICGEIERLRKITLYDTPTFISRARKRHGELYLYDNTVYKHRRENLTITCRRHGDFEQRPDRHLGGQGCPKCAWEKRTDGNRLTPEDFLKRVKEIHRDFYTYPKTVYVNTYTPITITCPTHGDFEQTPKNHLVGKGCLRCKESKGERAVCSLLDKYGINYQREYSFAQSLYRYDFFLPDQNILIEYHGKQHYQAVEWFNGEEGLKETKIRDACKVKLAQDEGVPLIILNYQHLNSDCLEQALIRQLKIVYRYWFKDNGLIRTFKYSEEVSEHFKLKCSPITRVTEDIVTRSCLGTSLLFNQDVKAS